MPLTENAVTVLNRRIAKKDENGEALENPEQIFFRVAENIAQAEAKYGGDVTVTTLKFFDLLSSLDFLPNSPTLVNAGRELQQLSACFVLPVGDSMEEIFEAVKQAALIHKTGGGTGFSFSRLRPASSVVDSTSGVASGPVSFMQVFDKATEVIKQGGTRRGANMGILRVDHPDILDFIHIKDDLSKLNNFNISVAITDEFMEALAAGTSYNLVNPKTGEISGTYDARSVWTEITTSAHVTGDPGVIFIDRINSGKANPVPSRGSIESTNPCGEQPLYPWDSCNLGSINLSNFVIRRDGALEVDYPRLADVVATAVHFLDNVIDMNHYPLPQIDEVSKAIRRIGLGVMGWADMLIKLEIPYNSEEAIQLAESVMQSIQASADKASIVLGMKRGSFPDFGDSIYNDWPALRHSTRTTIAPTGTISIIAGCSSGIEPLFALEFTRSHYLDKDPNKRHEMTERHSAWDGEFKPAYLVTANDISPEWHVRMQAAFQKFTDNAVSKTINLAKWATVDDVRRSYELAWELGCNGITVYRDGSRDNQVLSTSGERGMDVVSREAVIDGPIRRKLPRERNSITHRVDLGETETFITVGLYDDGTPGEIFIVANRAGSSTRGYLDSFATMLSYSLQYGVPLDKICSKLTATRFEPSGFTGNPDIPATTSIIDYIARWLRRRFIDKVEIEEYNKEPSGDLCPECDGIMFYAEGCSTCGSCGYSKCG